MCWKAEPDASAPGITYLSRIFCQTNGAFSALPPPLTGTLPRVVFLPQRALPSLILRALALFAVVRFALALVQLLSLSLFFVLPAFPQRPLPYQPIR